MMPGPGTMAGANDLADLTDPEVCEPGLARPSGIA